MKDMNALLAGFGGQGILFMGKVIAYAGLTDGRKFHGFRPTAPR